MNVSSQASCVPDHEDDPPVLNDLDDKMNIEDPYDRLKLAQLCLENNWKEKKWYKSHQRSWEHINLHILKFPFSTTWSEGVIVYECASHSSNIKLNFL